MAPHTSLEEARGRGAAREVGLADGGATDPVARREKARTASQPVVDCASARPQRVQGQRQSDQRRIMALPPEHASKQDTADN